eukprot:scaffold1197_cov228-Pinguiococcus_pyrenoidosus.AAC.12
MLFAIGESRGDTRLPFLYVLKQAQVHGTHLRRYDGMPVDMILEPIMIIAMLSERAKRAKERKGRRSKRAKERN